MKKVFLFISVVFSTQCFSQDQAYARNVLDTLTSSYFSGRGALNNGEKNAGTYIKNEFKKAGLNSLEQGFFQEFSSPINVFPGKTDVEVDGTSFKVGEDFLIAPSSRGVNGTFELVWYDKKSAPPENRLKNLALKSYFNDKVIVIDDKDVDKDDPVFRLLKGNRYNAAGLIKIEDKLTHSLSKKRDYFVGLKMLRGKIKKSSKSIKIHLEQKFLGDYKSQNVIGMIPGTKYPDSVIILSAHYDHLGKLGEEVYFPGANDNASGVALMLNLAKYFALEKPKKTIVFIAFGAEEIGLVGSKHFVENPLIPLKRINFVFNMDLMGTGSEGGMIVNGRVFTEHFERLKSINDEKGYFKEIKKRGKAANSDHYWFSEHNIPAFFMYLMGGKSAYHDIEDVSKTLPLTKYDDTFRLIRDFIVEL